MDTKGASENTRERVKTLFRLWFRNKISNSIDSIKDEEFVEMWECKPTFAGEHFYDENSLLFKFVSCPEHISSNSIVDKKWIKMRENLHYLYLYVQTLAEKSMDEIINDIDELLSKIVIVKQIETDTEEMDESEEEIITNQPRHRVHTRDLLESQFNEDDEDIIFDGWTWNTIIRSNILRDIVNSHEICKGLVDAFSDIWSITNIYCKKHIVYHLKELRELYFKALSSTAPENVCYNRKLEVLSIFTNRSQREIQSSLKNEEVKIIGKRISSMRIRETNEPKNETIIDSVFNSWLIDQNLNKRNKIPNTFQRLFDLVNKEQVIDDLKENLNEKSFEAIKFLDNPMMFDFLNGELNIDKFREQLFTRSISYDVIDKYLRDKRKSFEDSILKHISMLALYKRSIEFSIFRDTLSSLIKRTYTLWSRLLLAEIAKYGEYTIFNHDTIELDLILKKAKDDWTQKFNKEIYNPSVWGVCFRIINSINGRKYIDLRRFESNLLERVKRHEKKFYDLGNINKPWVKYKYATKGSNGRRISENNLNKGNKIVGINVCKFWLNSFRTTKGNPHPNNRARDEKYDRKSIIEIEYDFSQTPDCISRIGDNIIDYIQFGILYTHTTN